MSYIPYPTANIPNGWQIAGGALTDASKQVGDFGDRQAKLREQILEMADKKAKALLDARAAEDAHAEAERKDAKEKANLDYLAKINKGKPVSTPAASKPRPTRSAAQTRYGEQGAADLESLELPEDRDPALTGQSINGDDSTAMMGAALDAMPQDLTVPYSREEKIDMAHSGGVMTTPEWATATKAPAVKPKANPEIARAVRDEMILRMKNGLPVTKDDIRDIVVKNDPDGSFIASKEFGALINASSPRVAIQQADLASKRLVNEQGQFQTGTNIKLKEALDQDPFIKPYASVARKYDQTKAVYETYKKTNNPAFVDRTLVVNFNKLIDETSAVMGGEVDATIREMGVGDRLIGKIGKWSEGGAGFTDDERDQIMAVMTQLHDELKVHAASAYYTAKGQALDLNADPTVVTGLYSHLFEPGQSRYTPDYTGRRPGDSHNGNAGAQPVPAPGAPKVGDKKVNGRGRPVVYTAKGWVPQ